MREILFRGKRVDNGEWVCGYYVYDESGQLTEEAAPFIYRLNVHPCGYSLIPYKVIPETVGRYTGLTDKNGQKIFEGDIVKGKDALAKDFEIYGYIDHQNGSFVIAGEVVTHYRWLDYEVEVIGNIHDNRLEDFENGC